VQTTKTRTMLLKDKVIAIFCLVDDMLKSIEHKEYSNRKMSDSEVITTGIISALYFGGHMDNARGFMKETNLVPNMLDKSRFCRRIHSLNELIMSLFIQIGRYMKDVAGAANYIVDSFPVSSCHNIRISRSKLFKGEAFRGYKASMRQYFFGVKVQVLTTETGIPVEFCFVPGSEHDVMALYKLPLSVPPESKIFGDSAYTDYSAEDDLFDSEGIKLMIQRKSNSKRPDQPWISFLKSYMRKRIETAFSGMKGLYLKSIHAVTQEGFLLKLMLFIVAYTFDKLT